MNNTRVVAIKSVDADNMLLTLYYGRRQVEKAKMRGVQAASHYDLQELVEQFRLFGVDGDGNIL